VPESGIIWPLTLAPVHSRQSVITVVAVALTAAFLATLYALVPLLWGAFLIAMLVWFALPGVLFARRLYGSQPGSTAAALRLVRHGLCLSSLDSSRWQGTPHRALDARASAAWLRYRCAVWPAR
jgi:hypothetical protein